MKTEEEIIERLDELRKQYQATHNDTIDPELDAKIREISWVLDALSPWWES